MNTQCATRDNFEALLDSGRLEVAMANGRWWRIRRNGATRRWKRDPSRVRVPFKCGLQTCGQITEADFDAEGRLGAGFRVVPEARS